MRGASPDPDSICITARMHAWLLGFDPMAVQAGSCSLAVEALRPGSESVVDPDSSPTRSWEPASAQVKKGLTDKKPGMAQFLFKESSSPLQKCWIGGFVVLERR